MVEERAIWPVELEVRQAGRELVGKFPYGQLATMASRGSVRKERFSPGAFAFAIRDQSREINLLAGHSFDRPLASRRGGTLQLAEAPDGVDFSATLPIEEEQPTWMLDTVKAIRGGLARGISPGVKGGGILYRRGGGERSRVALQNRTTRRLP